MKTALLTLTFFLTGLGVWAQLPPPGAGSGTNNADMIRRRFRDARLAAMTNGAAQNQPVVETTEPGQPADAPTLVSTNLATSDAFAQAVAAAAARTNHGRVFSMPPLKGTNATTAPLGTPGLTNAPGVAATAPTTNGVVPGSAPVAGAIPAAAGSAPGGTTTRAVESEEPIIGKGDIDFPSVDINQVLQIYGELVGRTILRGSQLGAATISLKTMTPLTKPEAIEALDTVLAMNGITMINVGTKFVKAVPVGQSGQEGAVFSTKDPRKLPETDQYITQIVQLNYARPTEVIPALTPFAKIPNSILGLDNSGTLIIRDYAPNVKRMLELIKAIDVIAPMDFEQEVIPIKYALASDIASALGSLGGGTGASVGRSGISGSGAGRGGVGGVGGVGGAGGFGQPGYGQQGGLGTPGGIGQPGGLGTPGGVGTTGGPRTSSFSDRLSSLVNRAASAGEFRVLGQTKIIADERTNSLLVFAGKQDMDMIKSIIAKLDVVLAQVLIEAIIMEVNLSDSKSLGVSYLQTTPSTVGKGPLALTSGQGAINNTGFLTPGAFGGSTGTNGASALASGFSYLANFGGNFDATVTAAAQDSRVNILSRPRIQTSHAVTASLQVGETIPYVTGTYYNGLSGGPSSQYQQLFVGINLQVTPLINPDGLVVMDIVQDIQDLDGSTSISGVGDVPNTSKRTASAKVSVRDRDTIILGGFISAHKTRTRSGVPFLMNIPLLGYLFNSTSASNDRTELIVLIRPTVLPTPESAALTATREVNRSPAIKGAAAENRIDDIKRQKEADKIKMPKEDDDLPMTLHK